MVTIGKGRTSLEAAFEFDQRLVQLMRQVPGHEYDKRRRVWKFPLDIDSAEALGLALRNAGVGYTVTPPCLDWARDAKALRDSLRLARGSADRTLLYEKASELYRFQRVAVGFLADRGVGLLGDEMGLGKTVVGIATMRELELRHGYSPRHLIVCPNSKVLDWAEEVERWYPEQVDVHVVGKKVADAEGFHVVNWEKLIRRPALLAQGWVVALADESHKMKNKATKASVTMRKVKAPHRFLLSGTPIKNNVMDLWPQLNYLEPERWPSYWRFFERYVDYEETYFGKEIKGVRNEAELNGRLGSVMIARRTDDDEVEIQLPPLTLKKVVVELGGEQRKAYDRMVEEFIAWIEGEDEQVLAANWLSQVLRLKQIAGSLGIFYPHLEQSAKLDALDDLLDAAPQREKFVVMSQFRTMVDQATLRLRKSGTPYCEMTGQSCLAWHPHGGFAHPKTRKELIDHFQQSDVPRVFIATTQTGGEGITLTAARYFAFLDLLWTPADNDQAMKRVHRIGQGRHVTVYQILAKGTVDFSAILPTLRSKRQIIDAVMRNQ